jgi:hypothetical protein
MRIGISDADYAGSRESDGFESAAPIGGVTVRCMDECKFNVS